MEALNKLLNSQDPADVQPVLDALDRLSGDLGAAGGAVTDVIGAANSIANVTAPYVRRPRLT